jgi:multiple sugar transport system permease protein
MSTVTAPPVGARPKRSLRARYRNWGNWIYLLPFLFFFVIYMAYPILKSMWMSFYDYQYLSNSPAPFVGLQNFINAIKDPIFITGMRRALYFTILFLPGVIFIPLFLAILVDRVKNPRLATVYRLILLLPAVIPAAMIFVLWRWLYD